MDNPVIPPKTPCVDCDGCAACAKDRCQTCGHCKNSPEKLAACNLCKCPGCTCLDIPSTK